jgi:anti-anti-sigma factor
VSDPDARTNVDLSVVEVDGQVVVTVRGEIDLTVEDDLHACIERCSDGDRPLVLDLAGVTFMDSTGIKTLVWAYRRQGQPQNGLIVRNPSDAVQELLALSGLSGVFTIEHRPNGARQPDRAASRPPSSDGDRG